MSAIIIDVLHEPRPGGVTSVVSRPRGTCKGAQTAAAKMALDSYAATHPEVKAILPGSMFGSPPVTAGHRISSSN